MSVKCFNLLQVHFLKVPSIGPKESESCSHEFLLRALEAVRDVVGGLVLGDGVLRHAGHRRVEGKVLRLVAGEKQYAIFML